MKNESKLSRLLLVSPWFLLVFLLVPAAVIVSLTTGTALPLTGSEPLLVNNICLTLLIGCRLVRCLSRLPKGIRYGASGRPRHSAPLALSADKARELLRCAGFTFTEDGAYGEKRDAGFLGTTLLYAGLFILLATGSLDNLQQFAGVLLDGVGPATKLSRPESYRRLTMGPLSARPDALPKMQILRQMLPSADFPKGATEIALLPEDGIPVKTMLKPSEPFPCGAYDIYMSKMVFEPEIVIRTAEKRTLYDSFVKLDPLVQKRGDFSFYGLFVGAEVVGGVYYQPEKSLLKMVVTRNGQRVVADMTFQVDQEVTKGGYLLSCSKMGQWSEIHVVHRRHKGLLVFGGVVLLLGLLTRVALRPCRVWLAEEADPGSVAAVGKETRRILNLD